MEFGIKMEFNKLLETNENFDILSATKKRIFLVLKVNSEGKISIQSSYVLRKATLK